MKRAIIFFTSIFLGLLLSELVFKLFIEPPKMFYGPEDWTENNFHEKLGWIPVTGTPFRSEIGAIRRFSDVRPGKPLVVFLGDSVTAQGAVSGAMAATWGSDLSYLNLGVAGYNIAQETFFLSEKLLSVDKIEKPQAVVLLFHLNDYDNAMVALDDGNRGFLLVNSLADVIPTSRWLFQRSLVYQFLSQVTLAAVGSRYRGEVLVEEAMRHLNTLSQQHHFSLVVVVLPMFKPTGEWTTKDRERRAHVVSFAQELGICFIDSYPILEGAQHKITNLERLPGDFYHPSIEFGSYLGETLAKKIRIGGKITGGEECSLSL